MSLKDRLFDELKTAMKEKDTVKKDVIQVVRAGILQVEKDNKVTLDDDGVIEVISRELKKRKEVLPDYERSGREDKVLEINRQIEILNSYLPEQLSEAELEKELSDIITSVNATSMKDMGVVMKKASVSLKGRADGKVINEMVKKLLS